MCCRRWYPGTGLLRSFRDSGYVVHLRCRGRLPATIIDFIWPPIIERRMASATFVEALDAADAVPRSPVLRGVRRAVDAPVLQGREESLSLAIVPANSSFPHGRAHPKTGAQGPE